MIITNLHSLMPRLGIYLAVIILLPIMTLSCDKSEIPSECIQIVGPNILFSGVPNILELNSALDSIDDLCIYNGITEVDRISKSKFEIRPIKSSKLILDIKNCKKDNLLKSISFKVKDLPLIVELQGVRPMDGTLPVALVNDMEQTKLVCTPQNWDYQIALPIVSKKVRTFSENSSATIENNGAKFNDEQIKLMRNLQVGDFLIIYDISVKRTSGQIQKCNSLVFEIT